MEENKLTHRAGLVREAAEILNRYTPYAAERRVTFQTAENGWLTARLERTDGQPRAQSANPMDQKLAHLKDQTLVIRPFFLPMAKSPWEESDANDFTQVNFDYAAILGYGVTPEGTSFMKALYFLPTDALLAGQKPRPDGTWHLPLATYYVHQISLDPRKSLPGSSIWWSGSPRHWNTNTTKPAASSATPPPSDSPSPPPGNGGDGFPFPAYFSQNFRWKWWQCTQKYAILSLPPRVRGPSLVPGKFEDMEDCPT